jgi:type IV pilus assembly protein PilE
MDRQRNSGYTLVEVMVVVLIISVLASLAFPAYDYQVRKGHRTAAQSFMTDVANRQSQYLLDARNYAVGATALADLNMTVPPEVDRFYEFTVETASGGAAPELPPTFRIRATPKTGTKQVPDGELVLAHDGTKSRAGTAGW